MKVENDNLHNIKIRPIREDDYKYVLNWSMDENFCVANGWEVNRDKQEVFRWWLHCVSNNSKDFIREGIEYEERLVGYVDLANIKDNTAELGIAIGDSKLWGKGIGPKIILRQMDYAAKKLDITIFHAETHEANKRSRRMLEKIGFKEMSRVGIEEYHGTKSQLIQYRLVL